MKLAFSPYLSSVKPLLKTLIERLNELYPYASILAQDSLAQRLGVSKTGVNVSEIGTLTKRGFVIRVHDGRAFSEYAFNEISQNNLDDVISAVRRAQAGAMGSDPLPEDDLCSLYQEAEYDVDPEEMGAKEIVARLTSLREKALSKSELLLDVASSFTWQKSSKLFLTRNRDLSQSVIWTNGALVALAARGEEIKDYYKGFSKLGGCELINDMENDDVLSKIVSTALELLESNPIPPGEYDCICDPDTTGMIVHEAFGHGVEMDMFVKNRAQAKDFVGKRVASDLVNMHDGAKAANECATYLFDDEGTLACDTLVIEKGILKTGYADLVSANRLKIAPTGNGRRQAYDHKAYTRMTNTFFAPGSDKLSDMIASIDYGFLLENPSSGMEDPKNWGIQCMVNIAREIKDGRLTGRIFSPIVLTGYVPDLLKSISMMSDDFALGGGGFCGKGYKEWVKVSDGGPYIKAKIRLG
ncbi:MAG: TldD/PmbA family protein [Clostridiales bacterium]|nr:TldD/PmbA family protein [Clostridiales bacterium]